ncbi:MAG: choice-of-anchor B family protein [Flavobacteriales bacterium]|jgi:choice-of-anchor B domain-containing protein|nr:choice-of-anchor B family protein [Flavobacteriales bacterium]
MKKIIPVLFSLLFFSPYYSQIPSDPSGTSQGGLLNMQELGYLDLVSIHNSDLSDIWGWSNGNQEYAIVGVNNGTSVVDVTNPLNPTEVFFEPGMNSIWRDIKTYNGYAYVTTEAQNGLLIIDLNSLPGNTNLNTAYYTGPNSNQWESAHNLYIDENGICYIFGANRGNGGCIMLDLNTNPMNPSEVGEVDDWYVHDGVARGDTLYLAHISDGFMTMWDISTIGSPVMLGQQTTPGNFSHNLWISEDGNYVYTTDEITNGYIGEYDITDPNNMTELDRIQSSPGMNVIPHNVHFIDNYIVSSYYRDGVVIHDVSNKGNMVEVGNFDTSPNYSGDGFNGCWGVYPWLPSGNIIASDIEKGLYVLGVSYQRGCFLEGEVTDLSNSSPVNGASVEILGTSVLDQSSIIGEYATGYATAGTYDVVYSHPQYISDTLFGVFLVNGLINVQNVQLVPIQGFSLTVLTENLLLNELAGVAVVIENDDFTFTGQTDVNGELVFNSFYPGSYNVYVGKWGFIEYCSTLELIDGSSLTYLVQLEEGYADLFNLDLGWTVSGNAPDGVWERANPVGTNYQGDLCNPEDDSQDCGEKAYVTGNAGGNAGSDDVDQAATTLTSPVMNLNSVINVNWSIQMDLWWLNSGGNSTPNDSLRVQLSDGNNVSTVLEYYSDASGMQWIPVNAQIDASLFDVSNLKVSVTTADWQSSGGHLVEAGVDNFRITNNTITLSNDEFSISVFPNPSTGVFYFNSNRDLDSYKLYDLSGKLLQATVFSTNSIKINEKGVYILVINGKEFNSITKKIVVY